MNDITLDQYKEACNFPGKLRHCVAKELNMMVLTGIKDAMALGHDRDV